MCIRMCMYDVSVMYVTLRNVNLRSRARSSEDSCVTCNDTRNIIWCRMPSQAKEDREERRFLTMEDG